MTRAFFQFIAACAVLTVMTGCQAPMGVFERIPGKVSHVYVDAPIKPETGIASWYGGRWIGRLTANGETYRQGDVTAAHKKLPFHTPVRVTDLKTGKSVVVRINNRGPYVRGRIIDLSVVAAKQLGTYDRGLAKVQIQALREIPVMRYPNMKAIPRQPAAKPDKKSATGQ
ncbi:MAG: RplA [Verrucomicrobiota bacterium]|jgi:rare lipoprotein A (peptidoglycan hydrolase)